jgi:hypothetical protein
MLASLIVLASISAQNDKKDVAYMQPGVYSAASRSADPEALGGYGRNERYHTPVDRVYLKNGLEARLEESKSGLTLRLSNGTSEGAWFRAADSDILAYLEAKDDKGQWRPIQFKHWYTCGNSYHRLLLPVSEGWTFPINLPRGRFETSVRWKYYGAEEPLYSNEIRYPIPETRFSLHPNLSGEWQLEFSGGVPTLMPKR